MDINQNSDIYRDEGSSGIITKKNSRGYLEYKRQRAIMLDINNITSDLIYLKNEIATINQRIKDIEDSNVN